MLAAWAVELILITLRDFNVTLPGNIAFKSQGHTVAGLPLPADYAATFMAFAPLAALAQTKAKGVATAAAWGLVIATALNAFDATDPLNKAASNGKQ